MSAREVNIKECEVARTQMSNLITIHTDENGQAVSARELYEKLGIEKHFTQWWEQQAGILDLTEGKDFLTCKLESTGGRPGTDFIIPLDTAKHLSMISRGEKAHALREYFIAVEKQWNSPEAVFARALKMADKKIEKLNNNILQLEGVIEEQKPKALFADAVSSSKTSILIGELAKLLKQNGIDIGEKRLFKWLRTKGYLINRQGTDYNAPTQRSMELQLFTVKETAVSHSDGHVTISKTTKVTGRGQLYFIEKFLSKKSEVKQ